MRQLVATALIFIIFACVHRNDARESPLILAARAGDAGTIKLLIAHGADPNLADARHGWPPIVHAVHKHQLASVEALLAGGAKIDGATPSGTTALMMAAGYGHSDMVRLLLAHHADTRLKDANGDTPLDLAYSGVTDIDRFTLFDCQPETVRILRSAGAPGAPSRWARMKKCP